MKITRSETKVICQNKDSIHNYFAWPTVTRLKDGRLAVVCSGFRLSHLCPFGKSVIIYSSDEGKTWTKPAPVIDTPLDDRDSGIAAFGESSAIVTSFNNTVCDQRSWTEGINPALYASDLKEYASAYLGIIESRRLEEKYLGSTYVISHDNATTFGDIHTIPVSTPHGPVPMGDGTLLYVGQSVKKAKRMAEVVSYITCYRIFPDGKYEHICDIENDDDKNIDYYEPHAAILDSGRIIVHIRGEGPSNEPKIEKRTFTVYQCESDDLSKGFTKPHPILGKRGGSPAHILKTSDGALISVYGYRDNPYGVRAMFSYDEGRTWDTDNIIYSHNIGYKDWDVGYPASVELSDGKILTVFYAHTEKDSPAVIMQTVWSYEK